MKHRLVYLHSFSVILYKCRDAHTYQFQGDSGINSASHGIAYITAVTEAEYMYISEFKPTKGNPYLALMGELWGVFCVDLGEN